MPSLLRYRITEPEPADAAACGESPQAGRLSPGSLSQPAGPHLPAGAFIPRLRVLLESLTCDTCFYHRAGTCPATGGAIRPCDLALADLDALEAAQ